MSVTRREILSRFGLALPLVPLLSGDRSARAATDVRRLCIVQWTNGVLATPFWPSGSETVFTLPTCLAPLAPCKDDVLILRGLCLQAADNDPLGATGHQSLAHLLTGARGAKSTNADSGAHIAGNATSIDQHVARDFARRGLTSLPSLEMSVQRGRTDWISFNGPARGPVPDAPTPIDSPYEVWKRFFAGSALGKAELDRLRQRRRMVLDVVAPDLRALRRRLGVDDQRTLDDHVEALDSLQKRLLALDSAPEKPGCVAPALLAGIDPKDRSKVPQLVRMQMDLIVTAFRCDLTRVSTLMLSNASNQQMTFTWLGDEFLRPSTDKPEVASGALIGHHEIAHAAGETGADPLKTRVDTWFVEQFAYLIRRLKETPDPYGGSLLDNTAVLFANHMDNGATHGLLGDVPFILAGRAGGRFRTGRSLRFAPQTAHNGLLSALGNAMGVETPTFGDLDTTAAIEPRLRG